MALPLIARAATRAPMTPSCWRSRMMQFRELGAARSETSARRSMCFTISNMSLPPISPICAYEDAAE